MQRLALAWRRPYCDRLLTIAGKGGRNLGASDHVDGSRQRIAVEQVDQRETRSQPRRWFAGRERLWTIARQQSIAHRPNLFKPTYGISPVIVGVPAGIGFVSPNDALRQTLAHDLTQPRLLLFWSLALGRLTVAPLDGVIVVAAGALHVGIGQIGGAVRADLYARSVVVHHRAASEGTRDEVMVQAEHVSHLVTRQQGKPVQHDLFFRELGIEIVERGKRVERRFLLTLADWKRCVPVVAHRAHAVRIQLHDGVHNFAGPRIRLRHAYGPAPSGAVGPLNGWIANIERRSAFGKIFHAQCIAEASLFERSIPPQSAPLER